MANQGNHFLLDRYIQEVGEKAKPERRGRAREAIRSICEERDISPLDVLEEDAQVVMDLAWKVIESPLGSLIDSQTPTSLSRPLKNRLKRFSYSLATHHSVLPTRFFLTGVKCKNVHPLGAGASADVFLGDLAGQEVAIKRARAFTSLDEAEKRKLSRALYRESLLWKGLSHPNILPFLGIAQGVFKQESLCMVSPWMSDGVIHEYLSKRRAKGAFLGDHFMPQVDRWLHQVSLGLSYLHEEQLVHGDLRGDNILVDSRGNAVLADFGLAMISESPGCTSIRGTGATHWLAPELIDPESYGWTSSRPTEASDVYAFACVCVELYSMQKPFGNLPDARVSRSILEGGRPPRPNEMTDDMWEITEMCWVAASERPRIQDVAERMRRRVAGHGNEGGEATEIDYGTTQEPAATPEVKERKDHGSVFKRIWGVIALWFSRH